MHCTVCHIEVLKPELNRCTPTRWQRLGEVPGEVVLGWHRGPEGAWLVNTAGPQEALCNAHAYRRLLIPLLRRCTVEIQTQMDDEILQELAKAIRLQQDLVV